MVRRRLVFFVLAASGACSPDTGPPARSATEQRQAVEACRRVFADIARDGDASSAAARILRGCADMHAAPACADAWRQAARTTPDRRIATAAAGCRAAYCPHLPTPKPTLCYGQVRDMTATELGPMWAAFERVVLTREMGEATEPLIEVFVEGLDRMVQPVVIAPPTAPASSVTLQVAREGDALVVSRSDAPDRKAALTGDAAGDRTRIAPLVEGFRAATITTQASLQYQDVLRVMDALREAGVPEVTFGVEPQ